MPHLTLRGFLTGSHAWRPASPWHPVAAMLVAVAVIVLGQLVPIIVLSLLSGGGPQAPIVSRHDQPAAELPFSDATSMTFLLLSQATLALLTIGAASRRAAFQEVLSLGPAEGGPRAYAYALLVMVPLLVAINAITYWLSPEGFLSDFKQFAGIARGPAPVVAFVSIAVGAPLWEETLFRGFLLAPLAPAIGLWPATAAVSAAWALLHLGYSIAGLLEVFAIGLYFAWLLSRTGSLWVPIACHAAYNGALFLVLRFLPAAALA